MSIRCGTLLALLGLIYLSAAIEEPDVAPKSVNISTTNQILLSAAIEEPKVAPKSVNISATNQIYIHTIARHWFAARKYCEEMGYNLISLETLEKLNAINSYLKSQNYKDRFWTSGNDFLTPDSHVWFPSQMKVASDLWKPREPNNANGIEHCDEINYGTGNYVLNDIRCDYAMYFICERTVW